MSRALSPGLESCFDTYDMVLVMNDDSPVPVAPTVRAEWFDISPKEIIGVLETAMVSGRLISLDISRRKTEVSNNRRTYRP